MPLISVHTTKELNREQQDAIKKKLGEEITVLPNKTEAVLMVEFLHNDGMYFAGERQENCAFVEVKLYKEAPFENKRTYTELIFGLLEDVAGLDERNIYVAYVELPTWGTKGSLK